MTGPWRLPGLRSLTNIAGKIHLVRHTPRLASENHVTVPAQPPRRVFRKADSLSSPILGVALHDLGGQVSSVSHLIPPPVVLTSGLRYSPPLVQTTPKTLLSKPHPRLRYMIYSL